MSNVQIHKLTITLKQILPSRNMENKSEFENQGEKERIQAYLLLSCISLGH